MTHMKVAAQDEAAVIRSHGGYCCGLRVTTNLLGSETVKSMRVIDDRSRPSTSCFGAFASTDGDSKTVSYSQR